MRARSRVDFRANEKRSGKCRGTYLVFYTTGNKGEPHAESTGSNFGRVVTVIVVVQKFCPFEFRRHRGKQRAAPVSLP